MTTAAKRLPRESRLPELRNTPVCVEFDVQNLPP